MPERQPTVEVALRIRPLLLEEAARGCRVCVQQVGRGPQVRVLGTELAFTYNYVFGPEAGQAHVYDTCVRRLVSRLFEGYNVTVLAYGQTSSGKTFTMGTGHGHGHGHSHGEDVGTIQRAVGDMFGKVRACPEARFITRVSFMELYQEQLFDLLADTKSVVDIREDGRGAVKVPKLTEVTVSDAADAMDVLAQGSEWRATGSTAMNSQSSRSHAIFTITVTKEENAPKGIRSAGTSSIAASSSACASSSCQGWTAKFHFVDLAGSERQNKSKSSGERLRESISINRGLLALGNVIAALGEDCPRTHVTYRDSKLTRLLQDSLGGNSFTLLVACVSPADYNESETLSTLRYADRARRIKNRPIVNTNGVPGQTVALTVAASTGAATAGTMDAHLNSLRTQKDRLRAQLADCDAEEGDADAMEERLARLARKNAQLVTALTGAYDDNIQLAQSALLAELERDRIKVQLSQLQVQYDAVLRNVKQSGDATLSSPSALRLLYRLKRRIQDMQLTDRTGNGERRSRGVPDVLDEDIEDGDLNGDDTDQQPQQQKQQVEPLAELPSRHIHCSCCCKHRRLHRCVTSPARLDIGHVSQQQGHEDEAGDFPRPKGRPCNLTVQR